MTFATRVLLLPLVFLALPSSVSAFQRTSLVERVSWIQGCWEMQSADRVVEEQWMAPRGNSMIGMGRTVRGGNLLEYELLLIREQGDKLAYEAHPSGQPTAVFLSTSISDSNVLFEDPQHDFPQRIGYQKDGADGLLAFIEGLQNGQRRRIEFRYRRAKCG